MHADHPIFLDALAAKRQVEIRFFHAKEKKELVLTCAPLDFGPLRGSTDGLERYQLWDLHGKRKPFNVTVLPSDVKAIRMLDATFDPAEIVTWAFKPGAWNVKRSWGPFS
ncbi:MAG: hypothetical protein U0169_14160 [Polyangiaceae bacterium]